MLIDALKATHRRISASLATARAGEARNPEDNEWSIMAACYQDAIDALAPTMTAASAHCADAATVSKENTLTAEDCALIWLALETHANKMERLHGSVMPRVPRYLTEARKARALARKIHKGKN